MFAVENSHCVVKCADGWNGAAGAGNALVVQNRHAGIVPNLPAIGFDAIAPIQILAVHKKSFIQQPNFADDLGAN